MIRYVSGNLLHSDADILVNPVNCEGVMGAGLAKAFKERYPRLFHQYATDCMAGLYKPGSVFCYDTEDVEHGVRIIACFPTKTTWRAPSRIEHIADGMRDLFRMMLIHNEHMQRSVSVALPKLGCGLGGLPWPQVHDVIVAAYNEVDWGERDPVVQIYGEKP